MLKTAPKAGPLRSCPPFRDLRSACRSGPGTFLLLYLLLTNLFLANLFLANFLLAKRLLVTFLLAPFFFFFDISA
jgi:hypothetical protein